MVIVLEGCLLIQVLGGFSIICGVPIQEGTPYLKPFKTIDGHGNETFMKLNDMKCHFLRILKLL